MSDDRSKTAARGRMLDNEDRKRARERALQAKALVSTLGEDEVALLRQIAAGWGKSESAAHFGLDDHRFEKMRARLFAKLNASLTTDAVRIAIYAELD